MIKKLAAWVSVAVLSLAILLPATLQARMSLEAERTKELNLSFATQDETCAIATHRVGKLALSVTNIGTFGNNYVGGADCLTGLSAASAEYPKNSGVEYLFGASFWVGAIVGRDTLVSVGADGWQAVYEFRAEVGQFGSIIHRSLIDPSSDKFFGAISEEDLIATYTDTGVQGIPQDVIDRRPHRPLHIEVTEASYAWSYEYADDFILFDYKIRNIGFEPLRNVFMGVYVDADVGLVADCAQNQCWQDDICGFVHTVRDTLVTSSGGLCIFDDTVNIAWIADNDGDPKAGKFDEQSTSGVTGTRIVRTPSQNLEVSFNWWIGNGNATLDFGPRERPETGKKEEPFRDFGTGGTGTPEGDGNKYYNLSNQEFDYDQVYTKSVRPDDTLWMYPIQSRAGVFSEGFDTRYLLSFGSFNIDVGETLPLSFAYVAGENFHTELNNFSDNLEKPNYSPDEYYANLGFENLAENAKWASWIYDTPGFDTDGDGFKGTFIVCCDTTIEDSLISEITCDSFPLQGDGVPDFKGASPPPSPDFWVVPEVGKLTIRLNGLRSETTEDEFLKIATGNKVSIDFEGYRVYIALDERESSYSLVASFDVQNYNKFIWVVDDTRPNGEFVLLDTPYLLETLVEAYSDTAKGFVFDPFEWPQNNPFPFIGENGKDSLFYFSPQDFNVNEADGTSDIKKVFPNQAKPTVVKVEEADPSELIIDDLTPMGRFKYYEYQLVVKNLLPTLSYWVNVTAFDFGSPKSGLPPLESSKTIFAKQVFAQSSIQSVMDSSLEVFIYPNPYRIDDDYLEKGFEGRASGDINRAIDRKRMIHFVNVPAKCTIRIFSIDGDLVREIDHIEDESSPLAAHATWDMITRNTQLVVSGIYYWSVEDSKTGETQIGKLVIVM